MRRTEYFKMFVLVIGLIALLGTIAWGDMGDILWKANTSQGLNSSPAITNDGSIIVTSVTSNYSAIYSFDPDGTLKWENELTLVNNVGEGPPSAVIGNNGYIIIADYQDGIKAFDSDGLLKWQYDSIYINPNTLAVDGNGVIYGLNSEFVNETELIAVNSDGSLRWSLILDYVSDNVPPKVSHDGTILVGAKISENQNIGVVHAITSDGLLKWSYKVDQRLNGSSFSFANDGTIFIGGKGPNLYALNPDGTLKWIYFTYEGVEIACESVIDSDGTIYFRTNKNQNDVLTNDLFYNYALNPDGTIKWKRESYSHYSSPVIGRDGTIYVTGIHSNDLGGFCAYNKDGTLKWFSPYIPGQVSSPTIDENGILYICQDQNLYAVDTDTGEGLANSSWPKKFHNSNNTGSTQTIAVSSSHIKIMDVPATSTGMETISITNFNDESKTISSITSSNPVFTVSSSSVTIPAGGSITVTVTFSPPEDEGYTGAISIVSDDLTLTVDLYGNVYPAGEKVWSYQTDASVRTTPAIDDEGNLYFGSDDNHIYALNSDGSLKWRFQTGNQVNSSPALDRDGTLYAISTDNYLYALDSDGNLKWRYRTGSGYCSSPAIDFNGTVYVGSSDGYFYAIDRDGVLLWKYSVHQNNINSSPSIGKDGTIYFGGHSGYFYALNPDGTLKWEYQTDRGDITSSPAISDDGTVYVGADDYYFYAFNPNGSLKWRYQTNGFVRSSPAIDSNGTIYFDVTGDVTGSNSSVFYALNPNGTLKWNYDSYKNTDSSPLIGVDGTIYTMLWENLNDRDSLFLAALNNNGGLEWKYKLTYDAINGAASPAISEDGIIFMGSTDGNLYAIGTGASGGLADSPWPKFRNDNRNTGSIHDFGVSSDQIQIMDISAGSSGTDTFEIYNTGNTDIVISDISSDNNAFTVSTQSTTIAPNSSETVAVTFSPIEDKGATGTISIVSDDVTLTVDLYGNLYMAGEVVYEVSIEGAVSQLNPPAISTDGTVYVNTQNYCYAIDREGTVLWRVQNNGSFAPALDKDGTLYFTGDGLFAYNPDGSQKWNFGSGGAKPSIGSDNTVYVMEGGGLSAITPTGDLKWFCETGYLAAHASKIVSVDGTIYVINDNWLLQAVSSDGEILWQHDIGGDVTLPPAIGVDGTIYLCSYNNGRILHAINQDGSLKWQYKYSTQQTAQGTLLIDHEGNIIVESETHLITIDENGTVIKQLDYDNYSGGTCEAFIGSDNTIYVTFSGTIRAYSHEGVIKWSFNATDNWGSGPIFSPTIDNNGVLYFVDKVQDNNFMLIAMGTGTADGLAESPWPKIHHDTRNSGSIQKYSISSGSLDFGLLHKGDTQEESFTITNYNDGDLVVSSISCDNSTYSLSSSSATIPSDGSTTVTVTFRPETTQSEPYDGTITITTNYGTSTVVVAGSALPPTVTVSSPNGGESLTSGNSIKVEWTYFDITDILFEYSSDGGETWDTVKESVSASSGYTDWTIPQLESTECLVRLTDVATGEISDVSDTVFFIAPPPSITLTSPNGGEQWIVGSTQDITWTAYGFEKVWIEYTLDGGSSWRTVTSNTGARSGSYTWTLPDTEASNCSIKISDASNSNLSDTSNSTFSIIPEPSLALLNLQGGEELWKGHSYTITWESEELELVTLEYSTDNGDSWTEIAKQIIANNGSYEWAVPDIESTECLVRISDETGFEYIDISAAPFSIVPPPSITVTDPNGDENWYGGLTYDIRWESEDVSSVKIEISLDGGSNWSSIVENTDAASGNYSWNAPEIESLQCLIRLTDADAPVISDTSDGAFIIATKPSIQVTSPNGGEEAWSGYPWEITWNSSNADTLKIEFSTDDGASWAEIEAALPATDIQYSWTVPDGLESLECFIRIVNVADENYADMSDAAFSIAKPPYLELTLPVGKEEWYTGSIHDITWNSDNVATVIIDYSIDAGANWNSIASNVDAATGTVSWTVPEAFSSQCLVRITDSDIPMITDKSETTFTVGPEPFVRVESPNGDEDWGVGKDYEITWSSMGFANVKIEYSEDGGTNWKSISESVDAQDGSISWTAPFAESSNCLVKVSDASGSSLTDMSDSQFVIRTIPVIALVTPNGGETWTAGTNRKIEWTSEWIEKLLISYSVDDGETWLKIADNVDASTGSYSWTLPHEQSSSCLIQMTFTEDTDVIDVSDDVFAITPVPFVRLSSPNGGEEWEALSEQDITWNSYGVNELSIQYSEDGGTNWITVVETIGAEDGTYPWTVPDKSSTDGVIRITDKSNQIRTDKSDTPFTILQKPFVQVTSPDGGEIGVPGKSFRVEWTVNRVDLVTLEYSQDNGTSWSEIVSEIEASTGSYDWTVPNVESSDCLIRISDSSDSTIKDQSETVFTIGSPDITVSVMTIDFGSLPIGGSGNKSFTVTNDGLSTLSFDVPTVITSDLTLDVTETQLLSPGESTTITITYSPTTAGDYSEQIIIASDDPDEGVITIAVTGKGYESDSPIIVENIVIDVTEVNNASTDTLDVVLSLKNISSQVLSDVSFTCNVDGTEIIPWYGVLDSNGDNTIDSIPAGSDLTTVVGRLSLPSSANHRLINVTEVTIDGNTYELSFENEIYFLYATSDDVPYHPAVDGYSFANLPGWSWHAFADECIRLDSSFDKKSNALFPFFSKYANWKGRSLGMAASSNVYFEQPSSKPFSDDTFAEKSFETYITDNIMRYSLSMIQKYTSDGEQTYDSMIDLVTDAKALLEDNHPFVLMLSKKSGSMKAGHAVSVYKIIENDDDGTAVFVVYDCDYADGVPRFVTISLEGNTFTYDGNYDSVGILVQDVLPFDFALNKDIFEPYTKNFVSKLWQDKKDFFGHASPARMLVTDPSTGNQIGFEDGTTLVNEITDASVVEIPNEEDGTGYAFYVPHGPDYTVEFFGQETGTMYVDMIAPQSETNAAEIVFEEVAVQSGTIAVLEEVDLTSATPPSLQIDLDGDGTTDSQLDVTSSDAISTEPPSAYIRLLSPSGGENWLTGSNQIVTWDTQGVSTVKLEYSSDKGSTWAEITGTATAASGAYTWTVPSIISSEYLIRISDSGDIAVTDICDGVFDVYLENVTTITHSNISEANENQAITFSASIESDIELTDVTLYYDVSGRRTFDKTLAMVSSNDQDYSSTLSQGLFTALGIEYYISTTDSDGKKTRDPVGTGYYSIQASLSEANSTYHIVGGSEVNSYRMISVPLELNHTSIVDQLQGRLPTGDSIYDWRIFEYVDDIAGYKEYPETNGFIPGNSIWIITQNESGYRLKTREGKSVTTSMSYQITLKPGWNLIADPWLFPISWNDIDNLTGATLSDLYSYEGNWSDPTSPPVTLEPWEGYAVRNMEKYNAVIEFQPIQAGTTSKIATGTKPLWTVQIAASGGGATDTANYLGAHKSSRLAWDRNDHVEPPPIGQYVSVAFPHDDWKKYPADYTVDMRPPENVTDGWAFDVRTNLPGEEITVSLMESDTVPIDLDLAVIDLDTGKELALFNGAFSFVSGDKQTDRHFAVTMDGTYQPGDDKTNVTPQEFVTTRSFPNPFNPSTTISYELSHQTDVVISIYNTLGQMVRKYDLGMKAPGTHDLVFETLGLTSGIYIYRVETGYATATDKMMFMK